MNEIFVELKISLTIWQCVIYINKQKCAKWLNTFEKATNHYFVTIYKYTIELYYGIAFHCDALIEWKQSGGRMPE